MDGFPSTTFIFACFHFHMFIEGNFHFYSMFRFPSLSLSHNQINCLFLSSLSLDEFHVLYHLDHFVLDCHKGDTKIADISTYRHVLFGNLGEYHLHRLKCKSKGDGSEVSMMNRQGVVKEFLPGVESKS